MSNFEKPILLQNTVPSEPTTPFPNRPRKNLEFDSTTRLPRSLEQAIEMSESVEDLLKNISKIICPPGDKDVLVRGDKTYPLAEGLVEAGIKTWKTPDDIPEWVTPEMRKKLTEWIGGDITF